MVQRQAVSIRVCGKRAESGIQLRHDAESVSPDRSKPTRNKPLTITTAGDLFGLLRKRGLKMKQSTAQLLKEIDRELD